MSRPHRGRTVAAIMLLGSIGVLFAAARLSRTDRPSASRGDIRTMGNDPIMRFRAPGTTLRTQEAHPSRRDPIGEGQSSSSIRQLFEMSRDPGDTVDAYRHAAQGGGWALVADGCSRTERTTAAMFAKSFGGFDATLVVRAQLDRPPAQNQPAELYRRGLSVTLDATAADAASLPVDAGLQRNDGHCLSQLDPADPNLQPPPSPLLSAGELCSGIPVEAAKAITPEAVRVEPQGVGRGQCWLNDAAGHPLFVVEQAGQPAAYYQDRELATKAMPEQILFSVYGQKNPDLATAVWVTTQSGPLVVSTGGALGNGHQSDGPLVAFATLMSHFRPAARATTPATAGAGPGRGDLVSYSLEGGIAGTMTVTVTMDGHATYTGGTPRPISFDVPSATMEELNAALARVNFAELSGTYGSGSGADFQSQVVTYRGKTVIIRSDPPAQLGPVTNILNRLLLEGSSHR